MDAYLLDWANLLLRWAHVITAVAWIGASFHFVGLDNSLTPPLDEADRAKGIGGELWAVHGGGFYHQQKYPVSPARLPEHLHWSMWESYSTWLTGFALFTVMYLFNAGMFLIDKSLFDWSPVAAGSAALGFLAAFWLIYDLICRVFAARRHGDLIVGALLFGFIVFASWLSCQLFAGRAAFLLVGAMLATTMSANVFMLIIPGQRKVVASLRAGTPVDPVHGQRGKQRSVHNTYFTLPVLFAMLSNHYSFTYMHPQNWLILVLMMFSGAAIRQYFVMRHGYKHGRSGNPWPYAAVGVAVIVGVIIWLAPATKPALANKTAVTEPATARLATPTGAKPVNAEITGIIEKRCLMCHGAQVQMKNVRLDTAENLQKNAAMVYQQVIVTKQMPMNNSTGLTDEERQKLGEWAKP